MIAQETKNAFNAQIANELAASNSYLCVASYFDTLGLKVLSQHFFKQSHEERQHALKLLKYLLDVNGDLQLAAIPAPRAEFVSAEDAIQHALAQEIQTTKQINALMGLSHRHEDYASASFLKWFVDEQVEEQASMNELLLLVRQAGPNNLLLVEERLLRSGLSGMGEGGKDAED